MNHNTIPGAEYLQITRKFERTPVQGHPRSMILVPIESALCEFLLVINSNFSPVLHRFRDTATYLLKIAHFSYPYVIRRPRSLSSLWNLAVKLSIRKLESWGYSVVRLRHPNFNRL